MSTSEEIPKTTVAVLPVRDSEPPAPFLKPEVSALVNQPVIFVGEVEHKHLETEHQVAESQQQKSKIVVKLINTARKIEIRK